MVVTRRPDERVYVQLVHVDPIKFTRTIVFVGWAILTKGDGYQPKQPIKLEHPANEYKWERLPIAGPDAFKSG